MSMKLEQTEHEKSRLHQDSNAALQDVSSGRIVDGVKLMPYICVCHTDDRV